MAKRLIDAEELKACVKNRLLNGAIISWLFRIIDTCSTVDAVEVVRCKDCKHVEMTPDNLRWCNAWNSINGMGDEGYCNYGKRKGGQAPQREDV